MTDDATMTGTRTGLRAWLVEEIARFRTQYQTAEFWLKPGLDGFLQGLAHVAEELDRREAEVTTLDSLMAKAKERFGPLVDVTIGTHDDGTYVAIITKRGVQTAEEFDTTDCADAALGDTAIDALQNALVIVESGAKGGS